MDNGAWKRIAYWASTRFFRYILVGEQMPIFEYSCNDCGNDFELLVRNDTTIACDRCGSVAVIKKLSVFASMTGGKDASPACRTACDGGFARGSCGSGMCGHRH
jgi:putative FmdB family regulatory protein